MNTRLLLLTVLSLCGLCKSMVVVQQLSPPNPSQAALMARYIIHTADWVSIASISTQSDIYGYPFVGLKSMSDGPVSNSTGIPYLYLTSKDVSTKDLEANSKVTIMASLAQTDYCSSKNYDPQDPRCPKIFLTGEFDKLESTSLEFQFGQSSLFARHPSMEYWPKDHGFYVAKINPLHIEVLSGFGGLNHVSVEDYFHANITNFSI